MTVFEKLDKLPQYERAFVTIGNFDGIHLGHKKILDKLVADAENFHRIVITFRDAPRKFINPRIFSGYIFPPGYKIKVFESLGIDSLVYLDFPDVKDLSAEEFLYRITNKISDLHLYVGHDFRFGNGGRGGIGFLKREAENTGFSLTEVGEHKFRGQSVKSTNIRRMIMRGDMKTAADMLGRPYFIVSKKITGDNLGKKIGFPTLNLEINNQVLPAIGVYFTYCFVDGRFLPSMSYIGKRPTVNGIDLRLETHILNFDGGLENKEYPLAFIEKIRNEKKLHNLEELQKILYNDKEVIYTLAAKHRLPDNFVKLFGG
jgi:riboflavin kinase/FMN adenylyltransferase